MAYSNMAIKTATQRTYTQTDTTFTLEWIGHLSLAAVNTCTCILELRLKMNVTLNDHESRKSNFIWYCLWTDVYRSTTLDEMIYEFRHSGDPTKGMLLFILLFTYLEH
jgi:hypothetical protein